VLGDVHRAVDSGRRSDDLGRGVRAVVLERVAGQVVVVLVGVAVLLAMPSPVRGLLGGPGDIGPAAVVTAGVLLALLGLATVPRVRRAMLTLAVATRDGLLNARTGPAVAALSLVAMAGHMALLVVAALGVGVRATPAELLPLLVLSLLAMGLPLNVPPGWARTRAWRPRWPSASWLWSRRCPDSGCSCCAGRSNVQPAAVHMSGTPPCQWCESRRDRVRRCVS
jgi:hypothetical protein